MEIFISAVMGELATRSMSFLINKYSKPTELTLQASLERILLRAQVILDEAAGRHITNHGMLLQLSMLRDAIYQGYYVLDTFRYHAHKEIEVKDQQVVSRSWALPQFSHAQHFSLSSSSRRKTLQELEEVLDSLRTMILDASELVLFLSTYPHRHRQPYSMHLLLDKCMFSRQMEMEQVINFLLHTQPYCGSSLGRFDVLPIVGPGRAGKSTLVAHVCEDERVRDNFRQIMFFRHGNLRGEDMATLREGCENNGRLLVVLEVAGDLHEDLWERLCNFARCRTTSGSKIIITSRSEKIKKLGTAQAVTLKQLPHEAYWYFFKVITFGSTDPEMHPRLVYLAMEIARMLNESLTAANITACLLRDNFNARFWYKLLVFLRGCVQNHLSKFSAHPSAFLNENRPTYLERMGGTTEGFLVLDQYQTCSSQEEVPKITFQDVMYGSIRPHGTFKVLAWKSRIAPYHCCIYTCEIRELQARVAKRKRSHSVIRHC
ncbi:uncharacterized protein LOC100821567 isoform X2 [Brachypodium distachyon]|uniref:Disease resistance N-terminal domain-containing protein n=1 Tax=Brachypodium distachyon TaxID=15368 RepID=I1H493_BRADI|nr:uncharacterized protein LOC100821567 isoform X2 [Brachypodium distachyon]KQK21138.1 hypothetical protein BRADI_1g58940v3 [Brachypodium distachyon]|eukprot:XP_010228452.1 uncharacterized protein LOC100821567 isoform X2 [Brachypodium distachyon]